MTSGNGTSRRKVCNRHHGAALFNSVLGSSLHGYRSKPPLDKRFKYKELTVKM